MLRSEQEKRRGKQCGFGLLKTFVLILRIERVRRRSPQCHPLTRPPSSGFMAISQTESYKWASPRTTSHLSLGGKILSNHIRRYYRQNSMAIKCMVSVITLASVLSIIMVSDIVIAAPYFNVITVGDETGWTRDFDYQAWAKGKKFHVGDTLVFNYPKGFHNVMMVNGSAFKNCVKESNSGTLESGQDKIVLKAAGNMWFLCGVGEHCESGQKLKIEVLESKFPFPIPLPPPPSESSWPFPIPFSPPPAESKWPLPIFSPPPAESKWPLPIFSPPPAKSKWPLPIFSPPPENKFPFPIPFSPPPADSKLPFPFPFPSPPAESKWRFPIPLSPPPAESKWPFPLPSPPAESKWPFPIPFPPASSPPRKTLYSKFPFGPLTPEPAPSPSPFSINFPFPGTSPAPVAAPAA
ncbi:hypothetical protein SUGI_0872850 [Cryptomeria japonica]|nr:hypothetical protein SUGI_0872850 [Cryptomeria japonica]